MEHILFSYLLPFRTEEIVGVVGLLFPPPPLSLPFGMEEIVGVVGLLFPDELEDLFFSFGD